MINLSVSHSIYGKRASFCKCCEVEEMVTSWSVGPCLTIAWWWLPSSKEENQVRQSENLVVLDLGFTEALGVLGVDVIWKVIGSFTLSSRRFPWKVFQNYNVLLHVNVPGTYSSSGIRLYGKGAHGILCDCFVLTRYRVELA